ncbi:MAG: hypothetical protein IIC64_07695 [SAR324 cluster bacterium]|nr:hypothetical protein [SAR324 cluster bacterium]
MATNPLDLTDEEIDRQVEEAMRNPAVMEVSTWIEPNQDNPTDEDAYRKRLEKNGPGIIDQLIDGLKIG